MITWPRVAIGTTVALILATFLGGAAVLLTAARPAISSDESLYLSEAVSIAAGDGPAYSTGEPVIHRPFLFPALIAGGVKAAGADSDALYWIPRLAALAAAAVLALIVARTFGAVAGAAAGGLALVSRQVDRLGNSLYVDVTESLFLLLALLALSTLHRRCSFRACAAAGLALAAAFWTKESALLLLPLPVAVLAFATRPVTRRDFVGLAIYAVTAGVPLVAWWIWVARHTGFTYLAGNVGTMPVAFLAVATGITALSLLVVATRMHRPIDARPLRRLVGVALLAVWFAIWLWGLERHSWPYPRDYFVNVPRYFWQVGPAIQPFYLLLPAWVYVAYRALRGSEPHALLALPAALFMAFFIFTANRFLDLRDSLPLVYLSFGAMAVTMTDGARWLVPKLTSANPAPWAALATAVALSLAAAPQLARNHATGLDPAQVSGGTDWNGAVPRGTARWIAQNVAPGTTIMASRLYHSSIFSLNEGRYPVVQIPTLRVQFEGTTLRPMSTQFRWEDDTLWRYGQGSWLYLHRYREKGYDVGLTQEDLLTDLQRRNVGYLVVTGEDAGYSSFTFLDYYLDAPGLRLVHMESAGPADAAYIFAVDAPRLQARHFPVTLSRETDAALRADLGARYNDAIRGLGAPVRLSDEYGLPDGASLRLATPAIVEGPR